MMIHGTPTTDELEKTNMYQERLTRQRIREKTGVLEIVVWFIGLRMRQQRAPTILDRWRKKSFGSLRIMARLDLYRREGEEARMMQKSINIDSNFDRGDDDLSD